MKTNTKNTCWTEEINRTEFSNDVRGSPVVKTNVHELGNDLGLEFVKQTFAKIQMSDVFCIFNLRRAF